MTVALVLLAVVCVVLLVMWRRSEADARTYAAAACDANQRSREQELLIRHQCDLLDGYRAELDALSIAPPAAVAALQPDDPTLPDLTRPSFIQQVEAYVAQHAPKES